jgi:membrane-bound lytic murein transglycosylase F
LAASAVNTILRERPTFIVTVFFAWALAVLYFSYPLVAAYKFVTFHKVLKSGELTIITKNSANCYYLYQDQPMGFEYELAKAFADYLGVRLRVKIADQWEEMVPALMNGSAAVIAASTTITPARQEEVAFSNAYMQTRQHIITHRNNLKINEIGDLTGHTVDVRKGTPYQHRLEELLKNGTDFEIQLHEDEPTEELIQKVADGEIEITVADSYIALINQRNYPGAVVKAAISDDQMLGWAVHPQAQRLLEKINSFFKRIKASGKFDRIYNKYYGEIDDFDYVDLSVFHRRLKTRLSRYSPFIKAAAKKHGFDWRLIAAQIYQESHLNPRAKSHAGAKGLMQLLPSTAESLGVRDIYNPVENINAGVGHLRMLYDQFEDADGQDRILITLAAYNIGIGHIQDARSLAAKMNLDPERWSSLAKTLPLLTYQKYYKNSDYGYCRGTEPIRYIKQIMIYYDILKRQSIEHSAVPTG